MGLFLTTLKQATDDYEVEEVENGFTLISRPGREGRFSEVVRRAVDRSGDDFVVFPVSDGNGGYERAVIMPTD